MASYRVCCCYTRKFGIGDVETPADVKEMFDEYAEGGTYMTAEQLRRFLVEVQGETEPAVSAAAAVSIVEEVLRQRHHIAKYTRNSLSLDDFFYYLFSLDLNPPFHPQVHQDMTCPLSHYFIYTGHNSYLTGNQLTSECSDRLIIKALKQGVRVIELDLWPTNSKDDIQVFHGRTLTSPVDLRTCLRAIKDHAFDSSNKYPVIITLEDHLKPKLQAKAAQMITETIGHLLFYPTSESLKQLPSPDELKGKILISTKLPKECFEAEQLPDNNGRNCQEGGKDNDSEYHSQRHQNDFHENLNYDHVDGNAQHLEPLAYNGLIAIHQRRKSKLKEALIIDPDKVCRVSLSEQKLEKAITSHSEELIRFTQKNILRIYPKGARVDSSNYDPFVGWMHGAQMVAFNMQGYGSSLWQMQGMFRANGGCGYVKKPDFLMNDNPVFDPKAKLPVKTTLKVKVYMSDGWRMDFKKTHFDKYSPPDFYTKVGIAGVPADEVKHVTDVKDDQWIPVWNEEFVFPLTVPELALLRIEVHEYDNDRLTDDFGGQNYLPVPELRPGIHTIPLYSEKGKRYNSVKLLMRLTFV